jgi:hypothetical protein
MSNYWNYNTISNYINNISFNDFNKNTINNIILDISYNIRNNVLCNNKNKIISNFIFGFNNSIYIDEFRFILNQLKIDIYKNIHKSI